MIRYCEIRAGKTALEILKDEGITRDNIRVISGAAGGPKWLVLAGIDRMLFGSFFRGRREPLYMLGSSIGAWRFSAAMQKDPLAAIDHFEDAYVNQRYYSIPSIEDVTRESFRVFDGFISEKGIGEILGHPFMRMNFLSARAKGPGASDGKLPHGAHLLASLALNLAHRKLLGLAYERTLFHDAREHPPFFGMNEFPMQRVPLSKENYRKALMASGSIPLVMRGITGIPGAKHGTYRDGGMLDYHIDIPLIPDKRGIALQPHFINRLIPGWLDKSIPWRKAHAAYTDRTVLVSPSKAFLDRLPYGKIPDRSDFKTFFGNDRERIRFWRKVARESARLGDELRELIATGKVADAARPL